MPAASGDRRQETLNQSARGAAPTSYCAPARPEGGLVGVGTERETWVGNVTSYTMPNVSIDDVVIGVKALDGDGNQSLVSPYMEPVRPASLTPATARQ